MRLSRCPPDAGIMVKRRRVFPSGGIPKPMPLPLTVRPMQQVTLHEDLKGQRALVTGASRGMGHLIAQRLSEMGATVYAGLRDPERSPAPPGTIGIGMDVTDDESVAAAFARIQEETGQLDILVNNAGIAPGAGMTLIEETMQQIDEVLRINLRGAILVTKTFLPLLLKKRGSRIVNMSSGMGNLHDGMDGGAPAYRLSKTGINGLSVYLHGEFHSRCGLIVNAVCPGWVRTEMGGRNATRDIEKGVETPLWLCRFRPDAPSGYWWRDRQVIPW
jgi:NAD(P)-dependent dehydrogenase (short-subunit alcohol dehydrogenase family)